MDDLLSEFLSETAESLDVLDSELVKLEQSPDDPEIIGNIFRLLHTIKGTCGFLNLPRLEAIAHAGENILSRFRDGDLAVTPEGVTLVLEALDAIKALINTLRERGAEPPGDDRDLISRLDKAAKAETSAPAPAPSNAPAAAAGNAAPKEEESLYRRIGGLSAVDALCDVFYAKVLADDRLSGFFAGVDMDRLKGMQRALLSKALGGPDEYTGADLAAAHAHLVRSGLNDEHFDAVAEHLAAALTALEIPEPVQDSILAIVGSTRDAVLGRVAGGAGEAVEPADADRPERAGSSGTAAKEDPPPEHHALGEVPQSIRVNVKVLENLMTVVSELVLTRNQLLQVLRSHPEKSFEAPLQRLNQVTTVLQESVMTTRMQPVGNAWAKLPRMVRDLSRDLGKHIELEMIGADTELDRQVLELIKDPLAHMVRNSADHGIETPAERIAADKPEVGTITLSASHEGGQIVLEIADDGRGISVDRVKAKAALAGLATERELAAMPDQQALQFIFRPGFSTASTVTNVSGRGVGMDVAKTNIEKIGGSIELKSVEGEGSRFIIKIPLTLAIVSALIIECCGERFAIPQSSVVELVGTNSTSQHAVEYLQNTPVVRLRDRLVPLVSLANLLGLSRSEDAEAESYIVICQVGTFTFGIMVDRVFDTEEIVIKPVSLLLRHIPLFSGNTILGDGSVIIILDPNGIADACGITSLSDLDVDGEAGADVSGGNEKMSMVVFSAGDDAPKAIATALVSRLEEIDMSEAEFLGGRAVVQYRGALMPLIMVNETAPLPREGSRPILVLSDSDHVMGLVAEEILDIVEQAVALDLVGTRDGVLGSAIVAGHATDVLDVAYYVTQASERWFKASRPYAAAAVGSRRVLLVDDSSFIRNLLTPLLSTAGYQITAAESAESALRMLEAGERFDAIVSDIEMPGMDGLAFAAKLRRSAQWAQTPLIALSAHGAPRDRARSLEAGFTEHIGKLDKKKLLASLSEALSAQGEAA